jgi:hypothetical protein
MVRAVTIKTSAERRELPGAQFSARSASGADFGGQIGEGLQALSQGVSDFGGALENAELLRLQEQRQLRDFTLAADYTQFVADSETSLAEAGQNMEGGAWEFQKNFMLNNDASFEQWATDRGLSEAEQAEWRARHADVRRGLSGRALGAEFTERNRFYEASIKTSVDALRTRISQDPANYEAAVAESDALIERAGVSPAAKDALRLAARQDLASALAMTLVERNPAEGRRAIGGTAPGGGEYVGPTGAAKADYDYFRTEGLSDVAAAAALGVLSWESGGGLDGINPAGRNPGDGNDGSDSIGAGQWNAERADALKAFAEERGKPWQDKSVQLEFFFHELKTTEPEAYRRLQAATTIEEAVEAMSYYERPQGWTNGGDPEDVIHWGERVERAKHFAGQRADAEGGEALPADPRLADLPYEERVRLLGVADQRINQQRQADQQQQRQTYLDRLNTLRLQVIDGTAGDEQIAAARGAGWLNDAADIQNLNNMVAQRRQETAAVDLYDSLASTGGAFDPYNSDHKAAADAAFARDTSASNLQAIIDRTGFVPPAAADFVRGGLLSKDPERVKAVASLAAEVITRSPNAFTAFEGGAAINASAVEFLRLSELGFSSDQAASEVMRMNDPQEAERRRVAAPQVNAFREQLRRSTNFNVSTADFGGRALDPRQSAAVNADYSAIALEHFEQYANPEAARAFARRQVAALWGEGANGTIVKYPPEKIYPPVGGSHDYLYRQAAARIQLSAGVEVDPRQIFLMPVPGVTRAQWQAGQPPVYQALYRTERDGQVVYDALPNPIRFNMPTAALEQERASNEERFRRSEQRRENSRRFPGQSAPGMPGVGGVGF